MKGRSWPAVEQTPDGMGRGWRRVFYAVDETRLVRETGLVRPRSRRRTPRRTSLRPPAPRRRPCTEPATRALGRDRKLSVNQRECVRRRCHAKRTLSHSAEKERERQIGNRVLVVSLLLAAAVKADFLAIMSHLDAPWATITWVLPNRVTCHSVPRRHGRCPRPGRRQGPGARSWVFTGAQICVFLYSGTLAHSGAVTVPLG